MSENKKNTFGEEVKRLREEKGLTLKDLQRKSGITAPYIYRIETGERKSPSLRIVKMLAEGLEVHMGDLVKLAGIDANETIKIEDLLLNDQTVTLHGKVTERAFKDSLLKLLQLISVNESPAEESSKIIDAVIELQKAYRML